MGKGDAGPARREMRHLLPPRRLFSAKAVGEHDRRPAAGDLIVKCRSGRLSVPILRGGREGRSMLR
jgi:hypothetical protein